MKKIILFFLLISYLGTAQTIVPVANMSRIDLKNYNAYLGLRYVETKIPQTSGATQRQFIGNLSSDTLIAAIAEKINTGLIITPDNKIVVKTFSPIELYHEFSSEPEIATTFTWKGKTIYTQKILINWASPNIQLASNIDYMYYAKMVDVSTDSNGNVIRQIPMMSSKYAIYFDPNTHIITAYRPEIDAGSSAQKAEITIQYTKL